MVGLAQESIRSIDWAASVREIIIDMRSDFIFAPHIAAIFEDNSEQLVEITVGDLGAGTYAARLPITTSVPKSSFLTRPGSILEPKDRLVFHAVATSLRDHVEAEIDRTRCFSNRPPQPPATLFAPSNRSYAEFQDHISDIADDKPWMIKTDIANYFASLPQHNLINMLRASGADNSCVNLLEEILLSHSNRRRSFGILQGLYSSDLLGNYYLSDLDSHLEMLETPSARYVDDIYIGFDDEISARRGLVRLDAEVRNSGLSLSDSKTRVARSADLIADEREVDQLFEDARIEVENDIADLVDNMYGFQSNWAPNIEDGQVDLEAVKRLLDAADQDGLPGAKIDKFCLPALRAAQDDYAVGHALDGINSRPQLTKTYASYLSHFSPRNDATMQAVCRLISHDPFHTDYQRMFGLAALLDCADVHQTAVASARRWINAAYGPELRALSVIFCMKFGDNRIKRHILRLYETEPSEYVRAAIVYGSQYLTQAERRTAWRAWGGHNQLNSLIIGALREAG